MLGYATAVIIFVCMLGEISGTLDVTLLLFSGEPDREWQIMSSNPNYQKIQRLLGSARKAGFSYGPEKVPMELGYRGFLIKTAPTANSKQELILGRNTAELQKEILQTMPKDEVSKGIRDHVLTVIKQAGSSTTATKKMLSVAVKNVGPTWSEETVQSWGEPGVKETNNCYNYATDVKSKPVTQGGKPVPAIPGRGGGKEIKKPYTGEQVRDAATLDGLMPVSKEDEPPLGGPFVVPASHKKMGGKRYFVALFVKYNEDTPSEPFGNDFHWYRRDSNGLWSHKLGNNPPTNLDYAALFMLGNTITDPRLAVRKDKAYKFICFMTTDPDVAPLKIQ